MALMNVAATKLSAPATSPSEVVREGVLAAIASEPHLQVVALCAPAGFGKTTAMAQVCRSARSAGALCGWINLDRGDNDATRFLEALSAVLSAIQESSASRREAPAQSPNNLNAGWIAADLMRLIASIDRPFWLFLDEFETITEPTVLRLTRELIAHLPPSGHLIVASRTAPQIGLGRLRATGRLLELGESNLRFSMQEATAFLNERRHLGLADHEVLLLRRRTEGWIAAMSLASSVLTSRTDKREFIKDLSGSDKAIAQYLTEEVFELLLPATRNFLLKTCVVDEMTPELCDALAGVKGSLQILEDLERSSIFISAVDRTGRTYRYHTLFLQFLRERLARDLPTELMQLHARSASWYAAADNPVLAIDHWIEAGEVEAAVDALEANAESLLQAGRMLPLARWFEQLPLNAWRQSVYLSLIAAWSICFTRGPREAMELHRGIVTSGITDALALTHDAALQVTLLAMTDRVEEAYAAGLQAMTRIDVTGRFAATAMANEMAYVCRVMGSDLESRNMLTLARSSDAGTFSRMYSQSVEGIIDLEEGRALEAASRFKFAASAHEEVGDEPLGSAWAGVLHAGACYQRNEVETAERLLRIHLPLARDVGMADHLIAGYRMLSRISSSRGKLEEAFNWLVELEQIGARRQLPRIGCGAKLERARLLLLQGNLAGARDELDRAKDEEVWHRERRLRLPAHDVEFWQLADLRWQIHAGNAAHCIDEIGHLEQRAISERRYRRALKLSMLLSVAEQQAGLSTHATVSRMERMLLTAWKEKLIRSVLDEGSIVSGALRLVHQALCGPAGGHDPAFVEFVSSLLGALGHGATLVAPESVKSTTEPLTKRELVILRLLSEGYSNSDLAAKLYVSINTVRAHLRKINAKLNCRTRLEAVAVGRRIGALK